MHIYIYTHIKSTAVTTIHQKNLKMDCCRTRKTCQNTFFFCFAAVLPYTQLARQARRDLRSWSGTLPGFTYVVGNPDCNRRVVPNARNFLAQSSSIRFQVLIIYAEKRRSIALFSPSKGLTKHYIPLKEPYLTLYKGRQQIGNNCNCNIQNLHSTGKIDKSAWTKNMSNKGLNSAV